MFKKSSLVSLAERKHWDKCLAMLNSGKGDVGQRNDVRAVHAADSYTPPDPRLGVKRVASYSPMALPSQTPPPPLAHPAWTPCHTALHSAMAHLPTGVR